MDDGDLLGRKAHRRIVLGQRGVVPLGDLPEEDVGEHLAGELELGVDSGKVVDGNHRAQDRRKVQDGSGGRELLLGRHRSVGGPEEDRLVRELPDAPSRADRLVVDRHVGMELVVFGEPLRIDRVGERRAGAVDLHGRGDRRRRRGAAENQEQDQEDPREHLHRHRPRLKKRHGARS
jgi:hypothetical protein